MNGADLRHDDCMGGPEGCRGVVQHVKVPGYKLRQARCEAHSPRGVR